MGTRDSFADRANKMPFVDGSNIEINFGMAQFNFV